MCGIAGEFRFEPSSYIPNWEQISNLMARRGPDDGGLWSDEQHCALGFRRLSILDLSPTGHQPMLTQNGRYAIVYNGEMYNFRELRRELEQQGVRFRSTGDTEVVLHALAEWGPEALARFNGIFALGFYDTLKKCLLLARDHAGIKPLYYMTTPQGLVFASQYDQILAHPWSHDLAVSPSALALYLRFGYIQAPYALLQNTTMLEPGTWVELCTDGQMRCGRFFKFPVYRAPDLRGEEAYEAVDAAVTAAVSRQLISDVPVGTFLSGGIDSPLVAAKMREASNSAIHAFTIGTNNDHLDETADAAIYAREVGVDHRVEHVTADQALSMLDDVVSACGEPFADYSIFPTLLVSRMARRDVKVVLSGDGGDELFWGYAGRFGSVLQTAEDFQQPHWFRSARWGAKKVFGAGNGHRNLRWPSLGEWYQAKHTHIPEDWLLQIFPELPQLPPDFGLFTYDGWKPDETAQWLRWNEFTGHLTRVLLKVDRASMFHSLEVRVPLLDREVVEVAARVDWQSCLDTKRQIGKIPLRRSLERHVSHQTHSKRGFAVPMNAWLRGPLRPVFEAAVLGRQEIVGLQVNQIALRQMFSQHLSGRADFAWSLWVLLSLALWGEKYYNARYRNEVGV
jgi:asparagine synthase (glutamine-hydrolysing)